ncbi:MAG: tRNA (adenosine(37)-N6)-threonylcarbamoyltransferase complex dimerization subunit type 1 TsaB [Dehalococcoidia bacterium]|nr:tRNA (adenosine(37)-N6)-threonylcarbamoyltransferase complex dimerization subunit type 1 TsaB [Dehalococcoidia bacterium]
MTVALLLAVDTCTRYASVALARESEVVAELTWEADQNHTTQLAPRVQALLLQSSVATADLTAMVVATGPGSFNGVRTGMAFSKAMAFALAIPLVGLPSLEAQAYAHAGTGLPVCVIQDAGRGELAAAVYRNWRRRWTQVRPEAIVSWDELESWVQRPTLICGDLYPKLAPEVVRRFGNRAMLASPAAVPRRAGYLAELGWRRIERGSLPSPDEVQPLYLRRPAITERRKP